MSSVKMFGIKLSVITSIFLSIVKVLWAQYDDTCHFQGKQVTGDFTMPGFCLLYRCIPGQGVTTIGCGIRIPPEGCFIDHPATDSYPECCYTHIVCPRTNETFTENEKNKLPSIANPKLNGLETRISNLLSPPESGITHSYEPQTFHSGNLPIEDGTVEPQDVYRPLDNKTYSSAPYYYRK